MTCLCTPSDAVQGTYALDCIPHAPYRCHVTGCTHPAVEGGACVAHERGRRPRKALT